MQLLPILIALLLGGAALAYVLYPLYRENVARTQSTHEAASASQNGAAYYGAQSIASASQVMASEREETAKAALQEVELDYQLGNLGEVDYRSLKERYMRRAILAMKSRQKLETELDELIEARLRRMKEGNVAEEQNEE